MKAERWRESALCAQSDPDAFFPEPPLAPATARKAIAICQGCPVRADCLEAGRGEEWGIWGGVLARNRRAIYDGSRAA